MFEKLAFVVGFGAISLVTQLLILLVLFMKKQVRPWLNFMKWGLLFAAAHEFLSMVILQGQFNNFVFSMTVFYTLFVSLAFVATGLFAQFFSPRAAQKLSFLYAGLMGLLAEHYITNGLGMPDSLGSWIAILGMFAYWVSVGYFPHVMIQDRGSYKDIKGFVITGLVMVTAFTYAMGVLASASATYVLALLAYIPYALLVAVKSLKLAKGR